MFRNYLKITVRNLIRNKVHTLINLVGLSLGISCALLIALFVRDELGYDDWHANKDLIYRINSTMRMGDNVGDYALTSMAVAPRLMEAYPEIDTFVRFRINMGNTTVQYQEKLFNEQNFMMVDPQVFEVFSYPLIQGNPQKALENPRSVVITKTLADKYFGRGEVLGKMVKLDGNDYEVTGVMEDLPSNSDLRINGLTSMMDMSEQERNVMMWDWGRMGFYTYLLFNRPEDAEGFDSKLREFSDANVTPFWKENSVDGEIHYHIASLEDLHFRTDLEYDNSKGNRSYMYIFSMVALFILLIACINYINLAIAQSTRRSLEVGIRKAAGAEKSQLVRQFLGESVILSLLALGLAIIIVEITLPVFNDLAAKSFTFSNLLEPELLGAMLVIVIFTGLIAGSYPAFYLASFKPIEVLKGQLKLSGNTFLRKGLVIVQFTISIVMIISTLVVYEQMSFLKNHDLGLDTDQVLVIQVPFDTTVHKRIASTRDELKSYHGILDITSTGQSAPGEQTGAILFRIEQEGKMREKHFNVVSVDENFIRVMGLELLDGRNFERSRQTDPEQAFIVNEAFVKSQGWEDPVGKRMQWGLRANNEAANDGRVVGVVSNYHYRSLHNEIEPLIWLYNPNTPMRLLFRLKGGEIQESVEYITQKWRELDPNHPLEYYFLDSYFDQLYRSEERMMTIFGYFALLTILIACMGLFGVSSFIIQQRTKEVGIRKTLGAETRQIVYLLSKDFGLLVLVSVTLAGPVAWVLMSRWLGEFAFPVPMPWYAFILASAASLSIALLTTGYHSVRAARANPVEALRHE